MSIVLDAPTCIKTVKDPDLPPIREDERDQLRSITRPRTDCPDVRACLPLVQWLDCQIAEHRCRGKYGVDGDLHGLIVTALQDLQLELRRTKSQTVAELVARTGDTYRLDLVRIPGERHCTLAEMLDAEAQYYLDLETELGRLAAWAILWHSEGAEACQAETVAAYYAAEDEHFTAVVS